jgi:murein DD-endopeptidase MepM/ murein hydrolase activator NlpD
MLNRKLPLWIVNCALSILLAACTSATPPPLPTALIATATREPLKFATLTPILTAPALPTSGPTVTPVAEATPLPIALTPCATTDCARATEHFILERPIPADGNFFVDRTYMYGSTQQGLREPHHGIEFGNPGGTPVIAAGAGTVIVAGGDSEIAYGPATHFYGKLVVVQLDEMTRGQPIFNLYAHLSDVRVDVGQRVAVGDWLGAVGQTGVAIGPHLHFEVRVRENAYSATRNPELWLKPALGEGLRPYGVLAGRVTDLDGAPLFEQLIVIRPLEVREATRAKYITTYAHESLNGDEALQENFAVGDLPVGVYSVTVNTTTFYEQTVTIEPGRVTWVEFRVKRP